MILRNLDHTGTEGPTSGFVYFRKFSRAPQAGTQWTIQQMAAILGVMSIMRVRAPKRSLFPLRTVSTGFWARRIQLSLSRLESTQQALSGSLTYSF